MKRLLCASVLALPLGLASMAAWADHGDAFFNERSGHCVAVPEPAGSPGGRGTATEKGNAPFEQRGSTCGEDEDNPFPSTTDIPGGGPYGRGGAKGQLPGG